MKRNTGKYSKCLECLWKIDRRKQQEKIHNRLLTWCVRWIGLQSNVKTKFKEIVEIRTRIAMAKVACYNMKNLPIKSHELQ